jgi:hypothetical protein
LPSLKIPLHRLKAQKICIPYWVTFTTKQVNNIECGYLNELIAVLQHPPKLIKKLAYATSFKFFEVITPLAFGNLSMMMNLFFIPLNIKSTAEQKHKTKL